MKSFLKVYYHKIETQNLILRLDFFFPRIFYYFIVSILNCVHSDEWNSGEVDVHELWIVIKCDYWGSSAGCYKIKFSYLIAGIRWKYCDFLSFFSRAVYWFVVFWSCSKCMFISSQCKLVALFWNSPFPFSIIDYKEGIRYEKLKINSEHWESMKKNIKYWRSET